MSNQLVTKFAEKFSVDQAKVLSTLKNTCFKGPVNDEQMTALMIVADQYGLNPFTKEIYAFPDRNNGIVPVVGLDGWSRIINSNPMFDGVEFDQDEEACTCRIFRKDRNHPVSVTEYMSECKRNTSTWTTWPARMLRHKAAIQAARYAFGFAGIYDPEEAERIVESGENGNGHIAVKTKASISNLREKLAPLELVEPETAEVTHVDAEIIEDEPSAISEDRAQEIAENVVSNLVTEPAIDVTQSGDSITFETKVDKDESKAVDLLEAAKEIYADAKKNDRDLLKKMNEAVGGGKLLKDLSANDLQAFIDTFQQ